MLYMISYMLFATRYMLFAMLCLLISYYFTSDVLPLSITFIFPLQYYLDVAKRSISQYNISVMHAMNNASSAKMAFDDAAAAFKVS